MTSTLEDMEGAFLDAPCMAGLGDSITYKAVVGGWNPFLAYVDFAEGQRGMSVSDAVSQDISVQIMRSDIPVRPSDACRIKFGKIPGKIYKPVNVRLSTSGTYWEFEVVKVNA